MNTREYNIDMLKDNRDLWDIIVIGGGATGLGIAVDAASRGFKAILLEQSDFAKQTSSKSTKLVHGGVRYLQKGDISLVREALRERGILLQNAPHLVKDQRFIIGNYLWWEKPFYTIGLKMYDWLAGKLKMGRSLPMSKTQVIQAIPQIKREGLRSGVVYHDGQFDDSRLAISLMRTAVEQGAVMSNYTKVTGLLKDDGRISGVTVHDEIGGESFELHATCVINATGVFVDDIIKMDDKERAPMVRLSQGAHLVVDRSFLDSDDAIMIPKTDDGRVLFCIPWHNRVIIGTTDTPVSDLALEPKPLEEEIDFIIESANKYLAKTLQRTDILSIFAGLRPLAVQKNSTSIKTKEISRRHKLISAPSGLITITGGKWTTYRQMAQETIDLAIKTSGLPPKECVSKNLRLHGFQTHDDCTDRLYVYGSDRDKIIALQTEKPDYAERLHPEADFTVAEVVFAVREEMAVTIEDVLARRLSALYLDARTSIEMAPKVADIMADEMHEDECWKQRQIEQFTELANGHVC